MNKNLIRTITLTISATILVGLMPIKPANAYFFRSTAAETSPSTERTVFTDQYYSDAYQMPIHFQSDGQRVFVFNPKARQWAAYDTEGSLVAYGRANGGSSYCEELKRPCYTPRGTYQVYRKGDGGCRSNIFPLGKGGAAMPYCMFFHNGDAIHGSNEISTINGSHGCIRVTTEAAYWLHKNFIEHGTKVVVMPY